MRSVAHGVSWKVASAVVGQGTWYASLFVLAILLAPRDFAVMAIGSAVANFTLLVLSSGTGASLIVARDLRPAAVRRALIRVSITGIAATALFIALAQPIADTFTGGADTLALRLIALQVALAAVAIVPRALLQKHLRFKVTAQIWILAAVVASVASIVAAVLGAGVWALVIRFLVNQLLITVLTFAAARDLLPRRAASTGRVPRPAGATAFLAIAIAGFIAWTCDNLVVGVFTNPTQLGVYALAFSLAYMPLTQISWAVGQVLLPAIAAARSESVVRRQTLKATQMMALLLLPLGPIAVALAPGLIPAVLGRKWDGMVVPFQILVLVGVAQGVLNTLGESLAAVGGSSVSARARIDVVWAVATLGAIVVGVKVDGIRGASTAHVVTFCGLAVAYVWRGSRLIGLSAHTLASALRSVWVCVAAQGAVTAAVVLGLRYAGSGWSAAGLAGALAGVIALGVALRSFPELRSESRRVVAALRGAGA
jgi:PST family polysaccharide transporter